MTGQHHDPPARESLDKTKPPHPATNLRDAAGYPAAASTLARIISAFH